MLTRERIEQYLNTKFPHTAIKFLGSGWTTWAFGVGNDVFRFSRQSVNPYIRESAILDIVREYTRVPVPRLEIIQDGEFNYARHHMLIGHYIDPATYDKWPVTRRKKFASDCAAFLYDIHQIPRNRLTHIGPPTSNSPKPHHRSTDDVYPPALASYSDGNTG